MIKIVLTGALGRMGGLVAGAIAASDDMTVTGAVDSPDNPGIGSPLRTAAGPPGSEGVPVTSSVAGVIGGCDLLVDFSSPASAPLFLAACLESGKGFITGTTGLPEGFLDAAFKASEKIPVLVSPNMSAGVNLMFRLAREVASALPDFDVEICEIHHNRKKDAPSGTAMRLAENIRSVREGSRLTHGREGLVGERSPGEIGMHSLRGGDVTGEHTIVFAGLGERLELTHRAHSRMTFVGGTIKAIRFIASRGPGLYTMDDVLGL
ncbi:MAG TPA: 4-hydroxy-tetrahydrodipicolinate reductase [Candidatus Krumholzibacterium sp.]|nr:4-hydroxy-tetrahydrodipicolinate reductase [Candidatus Krumholzibacterium sp.]